MPSCAQQTQQARAYVIKEDWFVLRGILGS